MSKKATQAPFPRSLTRDRRGFLALGAAGGLAATALAPRALRAAEPKRGGVFKVGVNGGNTADSHDPGGYFSGEMIHLAHQYRSYLTLIEPGGALGPDLATSWGANDDATIWTFELNPEARFHDGRKVTARDVVASMNHHRGEASTSAAKSLLAPARDVRADGDRAVVFELETGAADLPWLMTDYHLAICPAKEDGAIDWASAIGSGPYRIRDGEPGQRWSLERHEGWHLEGAWFDAVEMTLLNDAAAREAALVTGAVDAVSHLDLKTVGLMRRNADVVVEDVPSAAAVTMPMHCDTAPFDHRDVRNALKYAIDREQMIQTIAGGSATLGNDFHVSPAMPYWPEGIEQRAYDPDRARSLLKKAGMDGLAIDFATAAGLFSGSVDAAVLFAEHAKPAGIDIRIDREPDDGYFANVWLKRPFAMSVWGARPTPDVIFTLAYQAGADWNESRWVNERFNFLLAQAKAELDDALRAEMYREMCEIARDDGGTIIPFFQNFVFGRRANVMRGDALAPSWELDGARAPSRWWFA